MGAPIPEIFAGMSSAIALWQWGTAARFPLHVRTRPGQSPGVTVFKPLRGADERTAECLRSWFEQRYGGVVQLLFGARSESDPVREVVMGLMREFPEVHAEWVTCGEDWGTNGKISSLAQMEARALHPFWVVATRTYGLRRICWSNSRRG